LKKSNVLELEFKWSFLFVLVHQRNGRL